MGLLCCFDGLANALLLGRNARPLADRLKVTREFLAYVIDSTSAAVACIAFISTWIGTQLSVIRESLEKAPFDVNPAGLFFASIPANPYCLLTLLLVPLVIWRSWHIGPMKNAVPFPVEDDNEAPEGVSPLLAVIPLVVLVIALPLLIYLWQDGNAWSWRNALGGDGVPHAMVAAGLIALAAAYLCFPRKRRKEAPQHMIDGAASLFPALLILVAAWTLGSIFESLGTAELLRQMLDDKLDPMALPLTIFGLGTLISFLTGTSWGTFGLLMPLVLPLALRLGVDLPEAELMTLVSMTIGAVFGGAVFGDHCSPFSDTTIVSSLASGCSPTAHVATQLPYAMIAAGAAALAYSLMWLGLPAWLATLALGIMITLFFALRPNSSAESEN